MSIMSFHRTRLSRITAIVTLTAFLAGCLPQNVRNGAGSLTNGTEAITSNASSLLASLSDMTNSISDFTGVTVPGSIKDSNLRSWSDEDQTSAAEARSVFRGEQLDDLPIYDSMAPGEAQRYRAKLKALNDKYKGRTSLNSEEMMEVSRVVVPLMRYLAKSRTYRESMKKVPTIKRDPKGHASIVVPAGMTMELALLTYCNDHGLPAPWSGEKLHLRNSAYYMPEALRPLYKDLHSYAATHPNAHYMMQSTVWWLRDNPCKLESLSDKQKALIETARPGGMNELQAYCSQEKIKGQLLDAGKKFVPGASAAAGALAQYQQYMATASDFNSKAQAFLSADLTDPTDLLELAKTSGLTDKLGSNAALRDPALKKLAPVLQQSGLIKSLIPKTVDDKAVATSLSVMEELGRQLGQQQGVDPSGVSNYSKLENGLYVEASTTGGASSAFVKVRNIGSTDQEFDGSNYVLTSVDDPNSSHKTYRPTQALSIGPIQPQRVYPNENDASRRYTPAKEKEVVDALKTLEVDAVLESGEDDAVKKQCEEREKNRPGSGTMRFGDFKLGILRDVIQTVPFLGNIAYGYSAITGKDWMTGETLSKWDRAVAVAGAVLPMGGVFGGLKAGIRAGKSLSGAWKGWKTGDSASSAASLGIQGSEAIIAYKGDDMCTAWAAGASTVATVLCGTAKRQATCAAYTAFASAAGNAPQVRRDTDAEVEADLNARLEYALAAEGNKPALKKPPIVEDTIGLLKGLLK